MRQSSEKNKRVRLGRTFYARDTSLVAQALLGKILCVKNGGKIIRTRIVETEAYLGIDDEACHSFGGKPTPRTEVMYGAPGHAYVYFIYGMYFCFNVVTREKGCPEAVLIRATEPVERARVPKKFRTTDGPGKLCRALKITRADNGQDLCSMRSRIWIESGEVPTPPDETITATRIGIDSKTTAKDRLLRFYLVSSDFVSRK